MGLDPRMSGKEAGDLILASEWNALVDLVSKLKHDFDQHTQDATQQFQTLNNSITTMEQALGERIDAVEGLVEQLHQTMTMLLGQIYRVKLSTSAGTYALGEQAEIVAQVTDFFNQPVTTRPWIDFVTTWGSFKAAGGTTTRIGEGSRSISVRADAGGEARVLLRPDYVDESLAEYEGNIVLMLNGFASPDTIHDVIMSAATPHDAEHAFVAVGRRYEESAPVRAYLDTFYAGVSKVTDYWWGGETWKDYHTAVLAVVKDDSDPLTPDTGRAYSSIQVTFRDWITSWVQVWTEKEKYPDIVEQYTERWREFLDHREFEREFDDLLFGDMMGYILKDLEKDRGIIGNERIVSFWERALDPLINPGDEWQSRVFEAVQDVLRGQTTPQGGFGAPDIITNPFIEMVSGMARTNQMGFGQVRDDLGGLHEQVEVAAKELESVQAGFETFSERTTQHGFQLDALREQLTGAAEELKSVRNGLSVITERSAQQGVQLDTLLSDAGQIGMMDKQLNILSKQVGQLAGFEPQVVMERMTELGQVQADLDIVFQAMRIERP